VPITHFVDTPMVLFANEKFPARTFRTSSIVPRAQPGKIGVALSGVGGVSHLTMELFRQRAGINLLGVPYKGRGAAMVDLAAGDVPLIFTTVAAAKPLLDSGRIRASQSVRRSALARFPICRRSKSSASRAWSAVVDRHDGAAWNAGYDHQENAQRIHESAAASGRAGEDSHGQSAEDGRERTREFGRMIRIDTERWAKVVKAANIKIEQ
jgi:hypothetical protein